MKCHIIFYSLLASFMLLGSSMHAAEFLPQSSVNDHKQGSDQEEDHKNNDDNTRSLSALDAHYRDPDLVANIKTLIEQGSIKLEDGDDAQAQAEELAQQHIVIVQSYRQGKDSGHYAMLNTLFMSAQHKYWHPYIEILAADVRGESELHQDALKKNGHLYAGFAAGLLVKPHLNKACNEALEDSNKEHAFGGELRRKAFGTDKLLLSKKEIRWWCIKFSACKKRDIGIANSFAYHFAKKYAPIELERLQEEVSTFIATHPAPAAAVMLPAVNAASSRQQSFLNRWFPTRARKVVALGGLLALGAGITYWLWNRK